jgi:hypothetical protein
MVETPAAFATSLIVGGFREGFIREEGKVITEAEQKSEMNSSSCELPALYQSLLDWP